MGVCNRGVSKKLTPSIHRSLHANGRRRWRRKRDEEEEEVEKNEEEEEAAARRRKRSKRKTSKHGESVGASLVSKYHLC